jgi:hypothetical protein
MTVVEADGGEVRGRPDLRPTFAINAKPKREASEVNLKEVQLSTLNKHFSCTRDIHEHRLAEDYLTRLLRSLTRSTRPSQDIHHLTAGDTTHNHHGLLRPPTGRVRPIPTRRCASWFCSAWHGWVGRPTTTSITGRNVCTISAAKRARHQLQRTSDPLGSRRRKTFWPSE